MLNRLRLTRTSSSLQCIDLRDRQDTVQNALLVTALICAPAIVPEGIKATLSVVFL
jgi:hypothetical protein